MEDKQNREQFKQWTECVEVDLEQNLGLEWADLVLTKVRYCDQEITIEVFNQIADTINEEQHAQRITNSNWDYYTTRKDLYVYLTFKLNAAMKEHTTHVRDKNGFEVYRMVTQKVEGRPTNAAFHMERLFPRLAKHCATSQELKLRMDRIVAAEQTYYDRTNEIMPYKTMKMTLWNCIDDETMKVAGPEKFDETRQVL